jgi:DNA polymerase-1
MPIQGTAADMIKIAMVKIDRLFQEKPFKSKMLLQVHDELVFEIPEKEKEKVQSIIRKTMENALPLSVPVEVDIGIGKNWLEAH